MVRSKLMSLVNIKLSFYPKTKLLVMNNPKKLLNLNNPKKRLKNLRKIIQQVLTIPNIWNAMNGTPNNGLVKLLIVLHGLSVD